MEKFTKLKEESDNAAKQHEEEKRKNSERFVSLEQELKEIAKALEKERKESVARGLEVDKEKKKAERFEQEMAKVKSEWDQQAKTKYPSVSLLPIHPPFSLLPSSPYPPPVTICDLYSFETTTKLREDNARLEEELERRPAGNSIYLTSSSFLLPLSALLCAASHFDTLRY